ncbi:MAG: hypothetical protein ABH840_01750 [Nanoarchaeota archaeon]
MLRKLTSSFLLASLAFNSGCALFIGEEKAKRINRIIEVGSYLENGLPNYYTKEEKIEREKEMYEKFAELHEQIDNYEKKYKKLNHQKKN